jgi:glycosyltransferase involved in cell wall biosynthesis
MAERGHEVHYLTAFASHPSTRTNRLIRFLPTRIRPRTEQRRIPGPDSMIVVSAAPTLEVLRLLSRRWAPALQGRLGKATWRSVEARAIKRLRRGSFDLVIGLGSQSRQLAASVTPPTQFALYLPQPLAGFLESLSPGNSKTLSEDEQVTLHEVGRADVALTASRLSEASVLSQFPRKRVIMKPLAAPTRRGSTHRSPRTFTSGEVLQLLYVGRDAPQKGLDHLFQALEADHIRTRVKLSVISSDAESLSVRAQDFPHAAVEVLGRLPRDEVIRAMEAFHALILPSLFEGFGLVVVEALSTGLPVLSTQYTAAGDLGVDGASGVVFRAGEATSISQVIGHLLDNPDEIERMSQNALDRPLPTWDGYRQDVVAELEAIVDEKGRASNDPEDTA